MKISKRCFEQIKKNKKKLTLAAALLLCICTYCITNNFLDEKANSDDIPLHDGDVLVDSSAVVTSDNIAEPENSDSYFSEMRATLDMERNKIISMLSDAEGSASTSAEKEEAAAEKMMLLEYMEQEKTIETLIKNKGLPEAFVVITDNGVSVTVNTEELDQSTVAKICEIIIRQTDRKANEIVVQDAS